METIKTANQGYVWLYGCRPKSISITIIRIIINNAKIRVTQSH